MTTPAAPPTPTFRPIRSRLLRRRRALLPALFAVALVAGACADSDSNRRFANEPMPTQDLASLPTQAPTRVLGERPAAPEATPIPIDALPAAAGLAKARFVVADGALWRVPASSGEATRVAAMGSGEPAAYAGSPDGDAVAVLAAAPGGPAEVRVLGSDGGERVRLALVAGPGAATPGPSEAHGRFDLAWSPDGGHVLVSLATGGLVEVALDGTSRVLLDARAVPAPRAVTYAPGGRSIAFVDAGADGRATALKVASIDALPIDPVTVIRPSGTGARQIAEITWAPGSAGILYSQRSTDNDLSLGGDLFAISPSGGAPRLIAAAGGASEVGVIGEFAVSADGTVVAYTVLGVVNGQAGFRGLWLHQIDGPTAAAVPAGAWDIVGGLVWTDGGLTWSGERGAGADGGVGVERLDRGGSVSTLFTTVQAATPVATPQASPVASPVATPELSPAAPPAGSPSV